MKKPLRYYSLAVILLLAVAPYFVRLGASSLWDSNEAFYAETPRVMIETNDFINPSFNDKPRFNKPPLSYWIVAASYKLFGVSEMSERLPIALGAVLMIAIAYGLGRVAYSEQAGLLAAISLAVAPRFLMFSRRIIIDVYVAMFMGAALLFFLLAERRPHRRKTYLALMYVAVGMGMMTKGPVAALLPALVFITYLAVNRKLGSLRDMMLPAGILIVGAIVLPWYVAVYRDHGWQYIETFILKDNLSRYTEPVWGPRRGLFFYLPVIIGDMFPWSLFLIPATWFAARERLGKGKLFLKGLRFRSSDGPVEGQARDKQSAGALLATWIIVIVLFFSISRNKEDLYILPIYTAAAALVSGLLARFIDKEQSPQKYSALRWATAILGLVLALCGAGVLYLFGRAGEAYKLGGAAAIGAFALAGGLIAIIAALMKRDYVAVAATAVCMIAANWVFAMWTLPDFEKYKPVRALTEIIDSEASSDAMVGYFRLASPSMTFYLRRPVFEYYQPDELRSALLSGKAVYCVMTRQDYEDIKNELPVSTYVLASRPVFQVKLSGILDRAELPQVVLISNKGGVSIAR